MTPTGRNQRAGEVLPRVVPPAVWTGGRAGSVQRHSRCAGAGFVVLGRLGDNERVNPASSTGATSGLSTGHPSGHSSGHSTGLSIGRSAELFDRALTVTPGGVNSPVRAFNAVGGTPRFIESARGAYLTDVDGNEYVDLSLIHISEPTRRT